jgi:hypothetical protein
MTLGKNEMSYQVYDVLKRYGTCVELIPVDKYFHDITIGLYLKNKVCTVWTFSKRRGVHERILQIRNQLVSLGGMVPVDGTHNQAEFSCGYLHFRPAKFLLNQAVNKSPEYSASNNPMTIRDTKSTLTIQAVAVQRDGQWVYQIAGKGDAPNKAIRIRMIVAGFIRYGEMNKVNDTEVSFSCGQRHDDITRLLLPFSRNISSVESMIAAEALRGQMTTGTLGFTPI